MASQREQIRALVDELLSVSRPGVFGPERDGMTEEVARKIHRLGALCRDFGQRELGNRFRAEARAAGRPVPRAELLDEDLEDRLQDAMAAALELRTCPAERVHQVRELLHSALEQAGVAASDPDHRRDAGVSREIRPRTREVLAMRRGDAEEMDRLRGDAARERGRVADAENRAVEAQAELARYQRDVVGRLVGHRDQLVADLTSARAELEQTNRRASAAQRERDQALAAAAALRAGRKA